MRNAHWTIGVVVGCVLLIGATTLEAQDWPQWRGPGRDNKATGFKAPASWPKELTKKWKVKVGIGESSPLLQGDKLFVFSRQGGDEVVQCLDADTGKEVWRYKYSAAAVGGPAARFPGTRSTPVVGEGKVCTLGVGGVVTCVDAKSGKKVWRENTKKPGFYTSTSPLIADGKCIVFGASLTAFDLNTGEIKWTGPGGGAPYGSPVLMTVDKVTMVVTPTGSNKLVGARLADGKQLWSVNLVGERYFPNYSTPLIDGDMVYYSVTGGRGGGGNMLAVKIEKKDNGFVAKEVWKKKFAAAGYHTPLFKNGLIYGVSAAGRKFYCLDAKTGNQLWKDDEQRGECGSILDVGRALVALTADKNLIVFNASNKAFTEVAKYRVSDSPTWCVPILSGNRIYVKDEGGSLTLWTIE